MARELPPILTKTCEALDSAETEYSERAYGPFWDCIAKAAQLLASYKVEVERMTEYGKQYSRLLEGREHSFPEALSIPQQIPDPTSLVARLRDIARKGQKDHQFAVIWEHHKTRRVLVEGFSTLENVLWHLGDNLQMSLEACAAEISGVISGGARDIQASVDRGAEDTARRLERIEKVIERKDD